MPTRPENDSSFEREPTAVEQAALDWVVRSESGLNAEEETRFAAWLGTSDQHRELFEEFGGTWTVMGQTKEGPGRIFSEPKCSVQPANRCVFPDLRADERGRARRTGRAIWAPLAVAAAIAIAYVGWWRPAHYSAALTTAIGASRQLHLPDGSIVDLNTDTSIAAAFTPTERRIRLVSGEAHFRVARNAGRPFVVEAAGVDVRAVGTAFNVRLRAKSLEVIVSEGKVSVTDSLTPHPDVSPQFSTTAETVGRLPTVVNRIGHPNELAAGDRVVIAVPSGRAEPLPPIVSSVPSDELRRILAWQGGRLDFSDTPLSDMVAEFNRYNLHKLGVSDPELAAKRFGGSFRTDDREGFVRTLRENFGVQAQERDGETLLHQMR